MYMICDVMLNNVGCFCNNTVRDGTDNKLNNLSMYMIQFYVCMFVYISVYITKKNLLK